MDRETKMLLVDVVHNEVKTVRIKNLQDIYENLCCDTIDVACRNVSGRPYCIYLDDEGMLKDPLPCISACSPSGEVLFGNLLIFNPPELDGIEKSLSADDVSVLRAHIIQHEGHPLLVGLGL